MAEQTKAERNARLLSEKVVCYGDATKERVVEAARRISVWQFELVEKERRHADGATVRDARVD